MHLRLALLWPQQLPQQLLLPWQRPLLRYLVNCHNEHACWQATKAPASGFRGVPWHLDSITNQVTVLVSVSVALLL